MLTAENVFKTAGAKINKPAKDVVLTDDLSIDQWSVPKGTVVKVKETTNFGWIVLPVGVRDVRGFEIPKRVFSF